MISNGASELLKKLIEKYQATGQKSFDTLSLLPCKDLDKKAVELHNDGFVEYIKSNIYDRLELTEKGISYKS